MSIDIKNMPVVIVDDQKTMLRIIRSLLKQIGFENVTEATDGGMAFTLLSEKPFSLIISDWNMLPMSGFELLKKVRADEKLKTIPFLMVTAESNPENVMAAKQAGVSNYIVKPFNADTLKGKLVSILGQF